MASSHLYSLKKPFSRGDREYKVELFPGYILPLPDQPFNRISVTTTENVVTCQFKMANSNGLTSRDVGETKDVDIPPELRKLGACKLTDRVGESLRKYFEDLNIELL